MFFTLFRSEKKRKSKDDDTNEIQFDLAERFKTSASSVNNIIITSKSCALHDVLYEGLIESRIQSLQMPLNIEITQDAPGNDMRLQASTLKKQKKFSYCIKCNRCFTEMCNSVYKQIVPWENI